MKTQIPAGDAVERPSNPKAKEERSKQADAGVAAEQDGIAEVETSKTTPPQK